MTANLSDTTATGATPIGASSIKNTKFDPSGQDQSAVSIVHIITLLVFALLILFYLIILKKYIMKFIQFFVTRKDFKNLYVLDVASYSKDIQTHRIPNEDAFNQNQEERNKNLKVFCSRFKQNFIQQINKYHPAICVFFRNCCLTKALKLPFHVSLWFFLSSAFLSLSLSVVFGQLVQNKCSDKRFYVSSSVFCIYENSRNELTLTKEIAGSALVALLTVLITLIFFSKLTQNYFRFLIKFQKLKDRDEKSGRKGIRSYPIKESERQQLNLDPTNQHILVDQTSNMRKSMKGMIPNLNSSQKLKNRGQEEQKKEEDFFKNKIDEIENGPHLLGKLSPKKDNDLSSSYHQQFIYLGNQSIQGNQGESTLVQNAWIPTSTKLNIDAQKSNQIEKHLDSPANDLNIEDQSHRISMIPRDQMQSDQSSKQTQNQEKRCFCNWSKKLIGLMIIILVVGGLLLDAYVFFNMTSNGLLAVLKMFGFALAIDFFFLRFLFILFLTLLQALRDLKNKNKGFLNQYYDYSQLNALGQMYKAYKENQQQYIPLITDQQDLNGPSSECDSDEQFLKRQQKKQNSIDRKGIAFGGLRIYKIKGPDTNGDINGKNDIILVEPTYLNQPEFFSNISNILFFKSVNNIDSKRNKNRRNENQFELDQNSLDPINRNHINGSPSEGTQQVHLLGGQSNRRNANIGLPDENDIEKQEFLNNNGFNNRQVMGFVQGGNINENKDQFHQSFGNNILNKGDNKNNNSHSDNNVAPQNFTLPPLAGQKGLQQMNISPFKFDNSGNMFSNKNNILNPGENASYINQYGVDSQSSPLKNLSNYQDDMNKKQSQDIVGVGNKMNYEGINEMENRRKNTNDDYAMNQQSQQYQKRGIFGNIQLPDGSSLFNLPIFKGIWGKNKAKQLTGAQLLIQPQMFRKRSLRDMVESAESEYYNLPLIVNEAENNMNQLLNNNDIFNSQKASNKGQILMVDTSLNIQLPFQNFKQNLNQQNQQQQQSFMINKGKKQHESQIVASQHFTAPNPADYRTGNSPSGQGKLFDSSYNNNNQRQQGQVVEIDSTSLYSLPLFTNKNLSPDQYDLKRQLEGLIGNQKYMPGQVIQVDSTAFYNLPCFTGKNTSEMQDLQNQLLSTLKNKNANRDVVEIDASYVYSLPMFKKKNKDIQDIKNQLFDLMGMNKRSSNQGEVVEIDASQFYNLPLFNGKLKLNNDLINLQNLLLQGIKNRNPQDVVQIDASYVYSLPLFTNNKSKEVQEVKQSLFNLFDNKKPHSGQIIEIDSKRFYNLPLFTTKDQLSLDLQNLKNLLLQKSKNRNSGEVIEIDASYLYNLPIFQNNNSKDIQEIKQQLFSQFENRNPNPGEVIQIDSSKFYNLPVFTGKNSSSSEMQNLQSILLDQVNKKRFNRDIVEIEASYIFNLPLFQNSSNKDIEDAKQQILNLIGGGSNRKFAPGEILQIDSTQFFNLPFFQKGGYSQEIQQLRTLLLESASKKKKSQSEIVQIDSTMLVNLSMFAEGAQLSQEALEVKNKLLKMIGKKQLSGGEVIQIDSSQLYDLTQVFGKAQLSPEMQELQKQLLSAMKRTINGEIVGIDATYIYDLSQNNYIAKQQQQNREDEKEEMGKKLINGRGNQRRKKGNRGEILGIAGQYKFDAQTNETHKIINSNRVQPMVPNFDSQNQFNNQEREQDSMDKSTISKQESSFHLPQINLVKNQMFETPDNQMKLTGRLGNLNQNTSSLIQNDQSQQQPHNNQDEQIVVQRYPDNQDKRVSANQSKENDFDPKYSSNGKKRNIQNGILEEKKDDSSILRNPNELNLFQQQKLPLFYESVIHDNQQQQVEDDITNKNLDNSSMEIKEKMDLSDFIKPKLMQTNNKNRKGQQNQQQQQQQQQETIQDTSSLFASLDPQPQAENQNPNAQIKTPSNQVSISQQLSENSSEKFIEKQSEGKNLNISNGGERSSFNFYSQNKKDLGEEEEEEKNKSRSSVNQSKQKNGQQIQNKVFELELDDSEEDQRDKVRSKEKKGIGASGANILILDSESDKEENQDKKQSYEFQLDDLKEAELEAENNAFKFSKRQQMKPKQKQIRQQSKESNNSNAGSDRNIDSRGIVNNKSKGNDDGQGNQLNQERREIMRQRIQEQKRKLKHFLQLAQQMKSQSDENKINELLDQIQQTKRPLPMSKINELKQLEMMNSPYNQSLSSMIKEEVEFHKKRKEEMKQGQNIGGSKRNPSQQQKVSDEKAQQKLKKLGGIYGVPNKGRAELKRDSSSSSYGDTEKGGRSNKNKNKVPGIKKKSSQNMNEAGVIVLSNQSNLEQKNMSSMNLNSSDDDMLSKNKLEKKKTQLMNSKNGMMIIQQRPSDINILEFSK